MLSLIHDYIRGCSKFLCRRSVEFFSGAFLVFLVKESKKRRRKQPGKLMAKSHSQPVNLPSARSLMNPLLYATLFFVLNLHSFLHVDDFKFSPVIVEELKKDKVANYR